jgi:hypothetical protein
MTTQPLSVIGRSPVSPIEILDRTGGVDNGLTQRQRFFDDRLATELHTFEPGIDRDNGKPDPSPAGRGLHDYEPMGSSVVRRRSVAVHGPVVAVREADDWKLLTVNRGRHSAHGSSFRDTRFGLKWTLICRAPGLVQMRGGTATIESQSTAAE